MNWEALGAIGETFGALAVFITLGYLAVQVRHARSDSGRALSQGRAQAVRELTTMQRDPQTLALYFQGAAAFGAEPFPVIAELTKRTGMTVEAAGNVFALEMLWWDFRLQTIPYVNELSAVERSFFEQFIRNMYGNPGIAAFVYENYLKPTGHPEAVRYIDNLLSQAD
jgi:hypothetical protein